MSAGILTRGYNNYGIDSRADGKVVCDGYGDYGYQVSTEGHRHPVCEMCRIRGKTTDLDETTYYLIMNAQFRLHNFLKDE